MNGQTSAAGVRRPSGGGRDRVVLDHPSGVDGVEGGSVDLDLDPSLAKWVALFGGIVCASLAIATALLELTQ